MSTFNSTASGRAGGRLEGLDYVLLGIGCTFTTAGLSFYFNGTADPHTIIFDNTRYVVRIEQKGRSVVIPYQDIAGFSRRTESSSSSGSTQTYYDYVVYWYKKDGSVWDIKTVSKAEKADELIDQLNQATDLQTEGLKNISLEVPRPVQYEETGSGAIFRWKNKFSTEHLFFFILAVCIGTACYGMLLIAQGSFEGWDITVFFGLFFTVLFGIVSVHLFRTIRNLLGVYQLKIDPDGVEFASMRSDKKLTRTSMPLHDVKSVMFDAQGEINASTLHILNTSQFEMVQKEVHGGVSITDAPHMLKPHLTNTIVLRKDGMDLVDQVHLEQLVEAAVRRAGNEGIH